MLYYISELEMTSMEAEHERLFEDKYVLCLFFFS